MHDTTTVVDDKELIELREKASAAEKALNDAQKAATTAEEEKAEIERKLVEAEAKTQTLESRMATIEREGRVRRLTDIVHGRGNADARWVGNEEQQVTFLMKLADTFGEDSDEVKHYVEEQGTHAKQFREKNLLLSEIGTTIDGPAPGSVHEEFENGIRKLLDGGIAKDRPSAIMALAEDQPALYKRYDMEQRRKHN